MTPSRAVAFCKRDTAREGSDVIISQGSWVRMTLETKEGLQAEYDLTHRPDGAVELGPRATLRKSASAEGTLGVVREGEDGAA